MNSYTKPNVELPVSLHDANISKIIVPDRHLDGRYGTIIFYIGSGFKIIADKDIKDIGKASVKYSGVDFDFSCAYYCKDNYRKKISFEELANDVKNSSFYILDECYGYNRSRLGGYMTTANNWYDVDIEIYHVNETLYEWDDLLK